MRTSLTSVVSIVALSVCVCLPAAEAVPLTGSNLIADGSFEADAPGPISPSDLPDGWSTEAYGASGQLSIVADAAPDFGRQSVQMRSQKQNSTGLHSVLIQIDPEKAYLQSGWIKVARGEHDSGLHLGRAWYTADKSPARSKDRGKNYNYIVTHANDREWTHYQQVLIPDQTPEDGSYNSNEIPPDARYLRIWALAYKWDGTGIFDGLRLYEIDYDTWARSQNKKRLHDTDIAPAVEDIKHQLTRLPTDKKVVQQANAFLSEFTDLKQNLETGKSRPVTEWIDDKQRLDGLIGDLQGTRWRLKVAALLQTAPPHDK